MLNVILSKLARSGSNGGTFKTSIIVLGTIIIMFESQTHCIVYRTPVDIRGEQNEGSELKVSFCLGQKQSLFLT